MSDILGKIKESIHNDEPYEVMKEYFELHKIELLQQINGTTYDLIPLLKLFMVNIELRQSSEEDDLKNILEFKNKFFKDLTENEKAILLHNIAVIYDEYLYQEDEAIKYFKEVDSLEHTNITIMRSQAYRKIENGNYEESTDMYKHIYNEKKDISNLLAYTSSSILLGDANSCIPLLLDVLNDKIDDLNLEREIRYTLAHAYVISNEYKKAVRQLEWLLQDCDWTYDIGYSEIADLYYLMGDYEKYIELFKVSNVTYIGEDIGVLLYAYFVTGDLVSYNETLVKQIDEEIELIEETKVEQYEEESERQKDILWIAERMNKIKQVSEKILHDNLKPEVKNTHMNFGGYHCSYIYCPRHF